MEYILINLLYNYFRWSVIFIKPLVSVICITYNQEQYIRSALDGFVAQKTDFPVEYIIHDDCSDDRTKQYIEEYVNKYPNLFIPIYEEENCYSRHIPFTQKIITTTAQGKYIAMCEGDDYWCDPLKLQKQADYMRANPECSLLIHNGYSLDCSTGEMSEIDPYDSSRILTAHEIIIEGKGLPPTASMFFRRDDMIKIPLFFREAPVGDRPVRMYLLTCGTVYYMNDLMCVYRTCTQGSFSQRSIQDIQVRQRCLNGLLDFFSIYDEYTDGIYSDEIEFAKSREYYFYYIRDGKKQKAFKTLYFKKSFTLKEKIRMYIGMLLPQKLKKQIKKLLKI